MAVLPFANLSPDPENEFFADGITDDLIAQVAKIGSLRVIARTSVMRYRGVQDAARTAAKELGVSAVVEGTVRRAGKRARIVAQLIDSSTDAPIWSETYDRDLDDVFSVQTEVATSVAGALKATLTPAERKRLARVPVVDAATYDAYLLGRHQLNKRTDETLRRAIVHFEACLAKSKDFAPAHSGLADTYLFAALGYAAMDSAEAFAKARTSAEAAVALDPESPEGFCALALYEMHYKWDFKSARSLLERAIASNANHAPAHEWLGWTLFSVGEYAEAARALGHAVKLDPLSVTIVAESGWPFSYAGLHEHAMKRYQRALEIDPAFSLARYNLGLSLHGLGKFDEAIEAYQASLTGLGRFGFVLAWLAMAYLDAGRRPEATALLQELEEQSRTDIRSLIPIGIVADALGEPSRALDALERAYEVRAPFVNALAMEGWIKLKHVRSTPRFKALMHKVGLAPHDVARQRALLLELEAL